MNWNRYRIALVFSNAAMMFVGHLLLCIQDLLPLDALQHAANR
jgi:K+-transporting ATPase ATPase A chain